MKYLKCMTCRCSAFQGSTLRLKNSWLGIKTGVKKSEMQANKWLSSSYPCSSSHLISSNKQPWHIPQLQFSCQLILWSYCATTQAMTEHYVLVLTLLPVFQNEPANSRIPRLVLQILISQGIVGSTPNLFNQPNPPRSGNLGSCWCNWSICLAKKGKQFNPATSAQPRAVSHFLCGAEEETVTSVGELKWECKKSPSQTNWKWNTLRFDLIAV